MKTWFVVVSGTASLHAVSAMDWGSLDQYKNKLVSRGKHSSRVDTALKRSRIQFHTLKVIRFGYPAKKAMGSMSSYPRMRKPKLRVC